MEKIELRCLKCGEPLDVMPDVRNNETGLHQFVSPCNNCIGEELKFFRNSFPCAAANYFKVSAQQNAHLTPESLASSQAVSKASAVSQSDSDTPPAQAQVA